MLFFDKLIDLGVAIGIDRAQGIVQDIKRRQEYERVVSDILKSYSIVLENASQEEEINLEGLIDFLSAKGTIEHVKTAVSGTQTERKRARASLYKLAYSYADADTAESKERITNIVRSVITSLRTLEREKVPREIRTVIEDAVEEIIENNENDDSTIKEINRVGDELKRIIKENKNKKQYDSFFSAILDNGGTEVEDGVVLFNLKNMDRNLLYYADEDEIEQMKKELGSRLKGDENREDIITLFWAEARMTINSEKRHSVMPMFQNYVRDTYMASIYADGIPRVVDRVHLAHLFWDEYDLIHLQGELYWLEILLYRDEPIGISMSYSFGCLSDVNERLFCFEKIKPIVFAKEILISASEKTDFNVRFDLREIGKEWYEQVELTKFWIEQMEKISEIEKFFGIHFRLPKKATDSDFVSIEILFDSLHRRNCRTLPGYPWDEEVGMEGVIIFDKEYPLGCPECLENVNLFGHVFTPVMEYVIPCELRWSDKNNCFEAEEGGIPTGVEFSHTAQEDF